MRYTIHLNESLISAIKHGCTPLPAGIRIAPYSLSCGTDLSPLAVAAGNSSRFNKDPNITSEQFTAVYTSWLQNSISGEQADAIFVAYTATNNPVGFITTKLFDTSASIGLMALAPEYRSQGIGKQLLVYTLHWQFTKKVSVCHIVTQTENTVARRLYERVGGILTNTSCNFHCWLSGEQVRDPTWSDIPNSKPYITERELDNCCGVLRSGFIHTHWSFGPKCQSLLEEGLNANKVLLVASGTAALEMSATCLDLKAGDEIIVPSYTFVSTALAFVTQGATPVFVDIRPDTQNIDETKIEAAITTKTRAVVCVHYAGVACEMDTIMRIAKDHNIMVIEDNAHGIYGSYKGRMLGTIGDLGCLSFHYTKNFQCGEGGALIVNNPALLQRAMIAWEKGTNRFDFLDGKVNKYAWVGKGGSYVLSELSASILHAQLLEKDHILQNRKHIWHFYHTSLRQLEDSGKLQRPVIPKHCEHNAHLYYIRIPQAKLRESLLHAAKSNRIGIFGHYEPLHSSKGGILYGKVSGDCMESDKCANELVRLPLWVGLSESQLIAVVTLVSDSLRDFS